MESKPYKIPESDLEVAIAAEPGVPYGTYTYVMHTIPLSGKQWAKALHLSERTIQRKQEAKAKLDTDTSERLLELARLWKFGEHVMGSKEALERWMYEKVFGLRYMRPIDLINTLAGIREVYNMLGRIEHGVLA